MADEPEVGDKTAVVEVLMKQGPGAAMAMDLPRTWATGAQAVITGDFTMIIFREQNQFELEGVDGEPIEPQVLVKNVASIVMPTEVARQFSKILAGAFAHQSAADADAKD
jgi:hypothetical protein